MLQKSPSGALSPYYYKGGYFHGVHYGSYFNEADKLREMMDAEEKFILKSPQKRRLMIDLYETDMTPGLVADFVAHIGRLSGRIVKLGISAEKKTLKAVRKALLGSHVLGEGQLYFSPDMEETKTWLVSDAF